MGQPHLIAKSYKDRVSASAALNVLLPGDLHYGIRADTDIPRPFGILVVNTLGRVYNSGGEAEAEYDVLMTIYVDQDAGKAGDILATYGAAFNTSTVLPSVVGDVRPIIQTDSTIGQDPDREFGRDVIVGTITWRVTINEADPLFQES